MGRPLLLDLFCGAGMAADGYHAAGFDVVGVDIAPQPSYPYEFHQADAMEYPLDGFDVLHASPPCQAKTTMSNRHRGKGGKADGHPDHIASIRWRFVHAGLPYVIENVPGARRDLLVPVVLSGGMFGLRVERPRLFESNVPIHRPAYRRAVDPIGVYGKAADGRRLFTRKDGSMQRAARSVGEGREAMGVARPLPWASLKEGFPPAYTEHIGRQLLAHLEERAA